MATTTKTKTTAQPVPAPKPSRGWKVITLRTPAQAGKIKDATKGLGATAITFTDRHVAVNEKQAQPIIDKVVKAGAAFSGTAGIFDKRVYDYFVAEMLLTIPAAVDPRDTLAARLVAVGRETDGFRLEMNQDGTLTVWVGDDSLGTIRAAMAKLAPDQVRKPRQATTSSDDDSAAAMARAAAKTERCELAKAEHKALKAWREAGEQGPRPDTTNLDALEAEAAKRSEKATAEARQVSVRKEAKVAPSKKDVTPIAKGASKARAPRKVTSARKAS